MGRRNSVARSSHTGNPTLNKSIGEIESAIKGDSTIATIATATNDASHQSTSERNVTV
jgi:hypothetical protein